MTEKESPWWSVESESLVEMLTSSECKDHLIRLFVEFFLENEQAKTLLTRMSKHVNLENEQSLYISAFSMVQRIKNLYIFLYERTDKCIMLTELVEAMNKLKWDERSYCDKEIIDYLLKG